MGMFHTSKQESSRSRNNSRGGSPDYSHSNHQSVRTNSDHSKPEDGTVVPVLQPVDGPPLGSGGFGIVYEVTIDPRLNHLRLDPNKRYALKTFRSSPQVIRGFEREILVLKYLKQSSPHAHIMTNITSWRQGNSCHILFDKADGNLRQYMDKSETIDLSPDRMMWFFTQLHGLTSAIHKLHHLRRPSGSSDGNRIPGLVCYHHDIKTDNLLLFNDRSNNPRHLPTLKLTDFGTATLASVKSFSEGDVDDSLQLRPAELGRGTQTYIAPESQRSLGRKMAQPADMWSLGCLFLEYTLWMLGMSRPDGATRFADMRLDGDPIVREDYDYFWQRDPRTGQFELNRAVMFALDRLEGLVSRDMAAFQLLVRLIRGLLVVLPEDRMDVSRLLAGLEAILPKLRSELGTSPRLYSVAYARNFAVRTGESLRG